MMVGRFEPKKVARSVLAVGVEEFECEVELDWNPE